MTKKISKTNRTFLILIIVSTIVFIVSTILFSFATRKSSDQATKELGCFYLREIAERNVNEITSELELRTQQLQNVLTQLDKDEFNDEESLKNYLTMVQEMNGLRILSMVDENGKIHVIDNNFSEVSELEFLSDKISEPTYYTTRSKQSEALVLIAVPTSNLVVGDTQMVTCLTAIDVDEIVTSQQMKGEKNQVYVRLFTQEGDCLVGAVETTRDKENIFDAWNQYGKFQEENSIEQVEEDWKKQEEGYLTYEAPESVTYFYYKPVPNTDWVVGVRLRHSIIETLIASSSSTIFKGSMVQLVVVVVFMFLFFIIMMKVMARDSKQQYEKEKEEEILRQQNILSAEKLLLQEQLLEEEKLAHRQDAVLQVLSKEYTSVYYIDLEEDKLIPYRLSDEMVKLFGKQVGEECSFQEVFSTYVNYDVIEEDQKELLMYSDPKVIEKCLSENDIYTKLYRIERNHQILYAQMKISRAEEIEHLRYVVMGLAIVDEKVREEQNQQKTLKDALVQAERANRAKTTFLSNMSHDIRTPMNAIIGFTSLALKNLDNQIKLKDYLKKIQTASDHLLSLINDILDMSRIESGHVQIQETECSLRVIAHELKSILQADIQNKQLDFYMDTKGIFHENIYCDKLRINQILINCLSNAVKFTPEGGMVSLRIAEVPTEEEDVVRYQFKIRDTGIGMSEEFLIHIFEPFERERTSTVSGIQGTGLGMAITKNIVDMMNGTICVDSEEGKGTEFIIEIPFKIANVTVEDVGNGIGQGGIKKEQDVETSVEIVNLQQESSVNWSILLVEDNELNMEIAKEILMDEGYKVQTAENGKIAVDLISKCEAGTFDLVLMDVQMPVMDGYTATREIRNLQEQEKANIPIIAMTANAFEEDKKNAFAAGMNEHVAKPLEIGNLLEKIEMLL